jgi:tetratricopeptide (TPR) repeat protein
MKKNPFDNLPTIMIITCCILGSYVAPLSSAQDTDRIERTGRAKELWDAANQLEGEEALKAVESLLQLNPKDHEAWLVKAYLLGQLLRPEEQISAYDELLKLKPKYYGVVWRQRANTLSKLKRYEEAIKSFGRALEADSHDPMLFRDRGMMMYTLGDYSEALADFERAKELKISDVAEIDDLLLGLRRVLRQLDGKDLPPKEWKPDYEKYPNIMRISRPSGFLARFMAPEGNIPKAPTGVAIPSAGILATKIEFDGTEDQPISFVPNFDVWGGVYIKDEEWGVLLENGTHFKYTSIDVKTSEKIVTKGIIEDWKAKTLSVQKIALPPSEDVIRQAIRKECSMHLVATGTELEIRNLKIEEFDTTGKYFPVYADVGFDVPTGFLYAHSATKGYFQVRKDKEDEWKAVWVEVKK